MKMYRFQRIIGASLILLSGAGLSWAADAPAGAEKPAPTAKSKKERPTYPTIGTIERLNPAFDQLIATDAKIEKLAEGFTWAEGPVWDVRHHQLLFSDVPKNIVYKWKEGETYNIFLKPSGYTGSEPRGGEPGSNGLTMDPGGHLILCEHGDRRIARLEKDGSKTTLAEYYQARRFNSPNDLVYNADGDLYFTDPPYGLVGMNNDPKKELLFSGVYRLKQNGELSLLISDLTFPNGIAFSPKGRTLYISVSDPARAIWMAYPVNDDGTVGKGRVFFDATSLTKDRKGLPDGMKIDRNGYLFATGPGGVLVFSPEGVHLGTINTGEPTANCAWGEDGTVLYITANHYLCRIKTKTKGEGF